MRSQRLFLLWLCALTVLAACQPIVAPTSLPSTSVPTTLLPAADKLSLSTAQPNAAGRLAPLTDARAAARLTPRTTARLYLFNRTDVPICYVYISPVTDEEWGADRLGVDETIAPDATACLSASAGQL